MTAPIGIPLVISLARLSRVAEQVDPVLALVLGPILDRALSLPAASPALLDELLGQIPADLRAEIEAARAPAPQVIPPEQAASEQAASEPEDLGGYRPRRPLDELVDALDESGFSPADWDRWAALRRRPALIGLSDEAAAKAAAWVRGEGAARIRRDLEAA